MAARISEEIVCTAFGPIRLSQKVIDFLDKYAPDRNDLGAYKVKGKKRQRQIVREVESAALISAWIEWDNGGVLEEY